MEAVKNIEGEFINMKCKSTNNRIWLGIVSGVSLCVSPLCLAEGSGDMGTGAFGVNRRVRTAPDLYVGVQATFSVPTISVPSPNTTGNKPTFYLGSASNAGEVDAGVQWESARGGVIAGWTLFISNSRAATTSYIYTNPQAMDLQGFVVPWRSDPNLTGGGVNSNVTSFELIHQVYPGGNVSLKVNAVGAEYQPASTSLGYAQNGLFYWNNTPKVYNYGRTPANDNRPYPAYPTGDARVGETNLEGLTMKRVIGITQSAPQGGGVFTLDNSFMTGCTFSNALLATRINVNAGGFTHDFSSPFTLGDIDQATTPFRRNGQVVANVLQSGYEPAGRDMSVPPKWIVDFSFKGMRNSGVNGTGDPDGTDPNGSYRDEIVEARYQEETVSISLLNPARPVGESVVPGLQQPR